MQKLDAPSDIVRYSLTRPLLLLNEDNRKYLVRHISCYDFERQDEYQRLRTEIFVKSLGWQIPVDEQGRERDHYDSPHNPVVRVYGVYGQDGRAEYLLGGVRLFSLRTWEDTMIMNEFRALGMVHSSAVRYLSTLDCRDFMEITRFCVRRGRWYHPLKNNPAAFNCAVARDLTYAGAYALSRETRRNKAVGIADPHYLQVMQRSHFAFKEISFARGVSLVIIDLWKTIRAISEAGDEARARRMLALCNTQ